MSLDDKDWDNVPDEDDEEPEYESGPFCRHYAEPGDCDEICKTCGHTCTQHGFDPDDSGCDECDCTKWVEDE